MQKLHGVDVPQQTIDFYKKQNAKLTDNDVRQMYLEALQKESFWVNTSDGNGVMLVYQDPATDRYTTVKNKAGKSVGYSFAEIRDLDTFKVIDEHSSVSKAIGQHVYDIIDKGPERGVQAVRRIEQRNKTMPGWELSEMFK
jgi:hypothetical protein